MSRARLACALAFFGILITTGGCAESATAPEAATLRGAAPALDRASNPTQSDSVANPRGGGGDVTVQSGFLTGGHRSDAP